MKSRLASLLLLILSTLLLSGCYNLKILSHDAVQAAPGSRTVTASMKVCVMDDQAVDCAQPADAPSAEDDTEIRYMVTMMVPSGTTAPASFATSQGRPLAFEKNTQLERVLTKGLAVPGYTWMAWTTAVGLEYAPAIDEFTVSVPLTLPAGADGLPMSETMPYRMSVHSTMGDEDDTAASAPVMCFEETGMIFLGGLPCTGEGLFTLREIVIDRGVPAQPTGVDLCTNLAGEQRALLLDVQRTSAGVCSSRRLGNRELANILPGTRLGDYMYGGKKNDRMSGGAGADFMYAAEGQDRMDAGAGADMVMGGAGNDILIGAAGNDQADGEDGNDNINGGAGNDGVFGDSGRDVVIGGAGNDVVHGGNDRDTLRGDAGNDKLDSVDDVNGDLVIGGPGRDTCTVNPKDIVRSCERIIKKPLDDSTL